MKRIFLFLLMLNAAWMYSQPKLELKENKVNFGKVKQGEIAVCVYEISNIGTAPLLIESYKTSCSCTTVEIPSKPILPGQKANITVNFDTKSAYGRQDRDVIIYSSDPSPKDLRLRYKGFVIKK